MNPEIYLSVAQAADLLGISQETLYKEIQSKNLTATESPDRKRKHQVIAHSELSRRYGNIYIPDGYLEYLRRQIRRLRENRTPAREPEAPQSVRRDPDSRAKPQRPTQNRPSEPQIAHRDPRRSHQNHRQPNRRAGQNDINPSSIVKLSIILYIPVIFTNKLKVVGTRRGFSVKPSSVGGNSDSRRFGASQLPTAIPLLPLPPSSVYDIPAYTPFSFGL